MVAGDARTTNLVLCMRGLRAPLNHSVRWPYGNHTGRARGSQNEGQVLQSHIA